jgi:hypothetical protein
MANIEIGRTEDVERAIAKRLGLDLSQIVAGSIRVESSDGRLERVSWQGAAWVEAGFMESVIAEVSR